MDMQMTTITTRHEQEMTTIMKRMEMLSSANDKFMRKNEWYLELEREVQ